MTLPPTSPTLVRPKLGGAPVPLWWNAYSSSHRANLPGAPIVLALPILAESGVRGTRARGTRLVRTLQARHIVENAFLSNRE
jgi:hypothetical protein